MTGSGPLRTLPGVRSLRYTFRADRVRRYPAGALTVAVFAALRLPWPCRPRRSLRTGRSPGTNSPPDCSCPGSPARLEGVPHNSLRSLRSLRSNRMRQVSLRSSLRSPPSRLRCSAPRTAPPPGTACRSANRGGARREQPLPAAKGRSGGARRACEAPSSAGFMARARSALRRLTWRILFERSERSERSELCAGPWTRAAQGSRSAAETASVVRRAPPGRPFAATTVRTRKPMVKVRTGPRAESLPARTIHASRVVQSAAEHST